MTRLLHVAGLATTLISHTPAVAETRYTCGPGVVGAVQRVTEATVRETTTTGRDAAGRIVAIGQGTERHQRQVYLVTVQLGGRLYTSASAGDPNGTLDPLRLATGDPIDICVSGVEMVLEAADATDYRAPLRGGPLEFDAVQESTAGSCSAGLQACHCPRRQP